MCGGKGRGKVAEIKRTRETEGAVGLALKQWH